MNLQNKITQLRCMIILGLLAASCVLAENQEMKQEKRDAQELGIRFSNLTGYGVSYQYNFLNQYYARATAWFKYYEYIKGDASDPVRKKSDKNYNFGLDLQRNIIDESKYRVFGFIGGGYAVREKIITRKGELTPNLDNLDQQLITAGIGGGIEFYFTKHISADLGVSYKFNYLLKKDVYTPAELRSYDETTKETALGVNLGMNLAF